MILGFMVGALSNGLRINLVVFGMGSYKADEDLSGFVGNLDHQPVFVPTNVENHSVVGHSVCASVGRFYVRKVGPCGVADFREPHIQWVFCWGVFFREFAEWFAADDVHSYPDLAGLQ